jgi:hypothetical protein
MIHLTMRLTKKTPETLEIVGWVARLVLSEVEVSKTQQTHFLELP